MGEKLTGVTVVVLPNEAFCEVSHRKRRLPHILSPEEDQFQMGASSTPLLASLAAGCAGVLELLPLDGGGRGAPLGDGAPTGRPLDVVFDILEHPHWEAGHQRLHQPPVAVGG